MTRAALLVFFLSASAEAGSLIRPEQLQLAADPVASTERARAPWLYQAGAGVAAAVVATPASIYLGSFVGSLSSNLVIAALPALITLIALPPLAVTLAEWWVTRSFAPGSERFGPAVWFAAGAQVLITVAAILLGADAQSLGHVALLTLAEAVVLPGVVTWAMAPTPVTAPRTPLLDERRPIAARSDLGLPGMVRVPVFEVAL